MKFSEIKEKEPAVLIGAIAGLVQAILICLVAFGVKVTADQMTAIGAVIAAIGTVVAAFVVRSKVTSPNTLSEIKDDYEALVAMARKSSGTFPVAGDGSIPDDPPVD